MKKFLGILIIMLSLTAHAQKLSQQFNVTKYAEKQTEMIKNALDLDAEKADSLYKANLMKAHSVQKYILLFEKQGKAQGKTLSQVIKDVEVMAEKASGYENSLHGILGEALFEKYMKKFGH